MSEIRLNAYKIMWVIVMFDLPTKTKEEKKTMPFSEKVLSFLVSCDTNTVSICVVAPLWRQKKCTSDA